MIHRDEPSLSSLHDDDDDDSQRAQSADAALGQVQRAPWCHRGSARNGMDCYECSAGLAVPTHRSHRYSQLCCVAPALAPSRQQGHGVTESPRSRRACRPTGACSRRNADRCDRGAGRAGCGRDRRGAITARGVARSLTRRDAARLAITARRLPRHTAPNLLSAGSRRHRRRAPRACPPPPPDPRGPPRRAARPATLRTARPGRPTSGPVEGGHRARPRAPIHLRAEATKRRAAAARRHARLPTGPGRAA